MAADLGVSRATLCRRSQELLGQSPPQAHEAARLQHAQELLQAGTLSVRHVGEACGFTDQRYFATRFRKFFGCAPSHMRQTPK